MKKKKKFLKVAIDSPSAAGAGTIAKLVSKHYNFYIWILKNLQNDSFYKNSTKRKI